jgi:hypothetical protein
MSKKSERRCWTAEVLAEIAMDRDRVLQNTIYQAYTGVAPENPDAAMEIATEVRFAILSMIKTGGAA